MRTSSVAQNNRDGPGTRLLARLRGKGLRMGRGCRSRSRHNTRRGLGLAVAQDLQLAREVSALFDRDSTGLYVSLDHRRFSHVSALSGFDIAVNRATYSHVLGRNIGA